MGKLIRLELFNFKSYKGHHVLLFSDSYFTSIIGPNGSGKSNSMDAISFVLGIKSSHLRSSHLRDLVYRGRILETSQINGYGSANKQNGIDGSINGNTNGTGHDIDPDGEEQETSVQQRDPHSAWVMAVYEDDDAGEEQRWKRTITSQGQSEYRINDRVVNAKQYNDALEAENILIKARNFLVFQGDVEAIASQSPKDLTRLVEQISGSLEYKADYDRLYEESEKANEDQTFKLAQRRTINSEIKQLSDQKKEVDDYNKKVDERDNAHVRSILWKLYHFQQIIGQSAVEIRRHQNELKEHRRALDNYEQRLEAAKREQAKSRREVDKVEKFVQTIERAIGDEQNGLVPVEEKIAISRQNLDKYNTRVQDISKDQNTQAEMVHRIRKDLTVVQKAQTNWQVEWSKLARQQGRQLEEKDLYEYNRLKTNVNKLTADAQIKIDNLTRQSRTNEETVRSMRLKLEEFQKQITKLQEEVQNIEKKIQISIHSAQQSAKAIEVKRKELNSLTSERLRTAQKQTELDEKLQEVLNKLIEADDGRRATEREFRAKETVVAMKRIFSGVRGRLHELCRPKQKRFETAVSTVLGRHFDAIVVETEKTAKDCISYLRDQRAGQATFIPLDTIQTKSPSSSLKSLHKKMRLAIDTVDYDQHIERAISYACGNAMVCDDLETAKHLCFDMRIEAKAVTLDGTIIHKGGLMTGGRGPSDRNGRKWEDAEVENLRRLKDKLLADIASLPRGHKAVTDEENLQGELTGLQQTSRYVESEVKALEMNLESKHKELSVYQKHLEDIKPKHEEKYTEMVDLQTRVMEIQSEVSRVEDEVFKSLCEKLGFDNIRSYEAQQGSLQQEGAQKQLEFDMQKKKLESQINFEEERLGTTKNRIESIRQQANRDEDLIRSLEAEKEAMQTGINEQRGRLESAQRSLRKQHESLNTVAAKVGEERREVQKRSKIIESALSDIASLKAKAQRTAANRHSLLKTCKVNQTKLPLKKTSAALETLTDNVATQRHDDPDAMEVDGNANASTVAHQELYDQEIELDFDSLDIELMEDDSPEQENRLEANIAALNTELGTLNPNMRAAERLKNAQARLQATETTFNAARDTARDAHNLFTAVREKRGALFTNAFNHISSQIGPIYQALTRSAAFPLGGQAFLDTTVPDDDDSPFLGGLKYHAMPPLKRFRDMDALSGGEKTIAALALLFAIHSYAPSPFFVLDEVDAALDNANVAKVARYIKEHAGPGMQFIVISLKTTFFQESDCLVGVLRDQSRNTSRTVTLDLRKYQAA